MDQGMPFASRVMDATMETSGQMPSAASARSSCASALPTRTLDQAGAGLRGGIIAEGRFETGWQGH